MYIQTHNMHNILSCTVRRIIWKQRGFLRADGTLITHGEAISALLEEVHLPITLNITKCTVPALGWEVKLRRLVDGGSGTGLGCLSQWSCGLFLPLLSPFLVLLTVGPGCPLAARPQLCFLSRCNCAGHQTSSPLWDNWGEFGGVGNWSHWSLTPHLPYVWCCGWLLGWWLGSLWGSQPAAGVWGSLI